MLAFTMIGIMTPARTPRIWLHPPEFWAATEGMLPDEVGRFMDQLFSLAEQGELNALREYDFISIEEEDEAAA